MNTLPISRPVFFSRSLAVAAILAAIGTASPAAAAKSKMLLQDLEPQGVSEGEAAVLTTSTCVALAKSSTRDVLCGDDLRAMMRFGAMSATFKGCEGEACFANLARALKARFVVSGTVSKLGAVFVLSLSNFDTKLGRTVGRSEVKAPTLEKLQLQIGEAVSGLSSKKR